MCWSHARRQFFALADIAANARRGIKSAPISPIALEAVNLVTGIALLAASVIAGGVWDAIGPKGTFVAGAIFSVLTLIGLLGLRRTKLSGGCS